MNVDARERLAKLIKPFVDKQGLRAYSRSLGVSSGTVSRWLLGDAFPDGDNRKKVARSLGMSLEKFDHVIVQGKAGSSSDPVEHVISIVLSMAPQDVARVQRAIADRVLMFTITGVEPVQKPMAAEDEASYSATETSLNRN